MTSVYLNFDAYPQLKLVGQSATPLYLITKVKITVQQTMEAPRRSKIKALLCPNHGVGGQRHVPTILPQERAPTPIEGG